MSQEEEKKALLEWVSVLLPGVFGWMSYFFLLDDLVFSSLQDARLCHSYATEAVLKFFFQYFPLLI